MTHRTAVWVDTIKLVLQLCNPRLICLTLALLPGQVPFQCQNVLLEIIVQRGSLIARV